MSDVNAQRELMQLRERVEATHYYTPRSLFSDVCARCGRLYLEHDPVLGLYSAMRTCPP